MLEIKFTQPSNKRYNDYFEVAKLNNKIIGFITINNNKVRYAFGKPSQSSYIAFEVSTLEEARKRIITYHTNTVQAIRGGKVCSL